MTTVPSAQAALQALDELFRENEIAMSDRNGLLHDALRQFIEGAGADSDRIDYLQTAGATVELLNGTPATGWLFRVGGLYASANCSLRASIDAAIAARSPQPGDGT